MKTIKRIAIMCVFVAALLLLGVLIFNEPEPTEKFIPRFIPSNWTDTSRETYNDSEAIISLKYNKANTIVINGKSTDAHKLVIVMIPDDMEFRGYSGNYTEIWTYINKDVLIGNKEETKPLTKNIVYIFANESICEEMRDMANVNYHSSLYQFKMEIVGVDFR